MSAAVSDRSAIRVNQLGYLPRGPKQATWVSAATGSMPFLIRDRNETPVHRGRSRPWPVRPDPTTGLAVHVLDFSTMTSVGSQYRVEVGGDRSHPFTVAVDLYADLAADALAVFYLLRSGCPISAERAPGYQRPAGHPGDAAVAAWTGPDADRLYPGWSAPGRYDVSGGWYDAGDYGKYSTSGGIAVWQLLNVLTVLPPDHQLLPRLIEECRWQLDWLLRMRVPAGRPLAGMVFHRVHGTRWSPIPGWAHEDPTDRVLHRPSTAATWHLAAVAALGSRLLRDHDAGYADRLLDAAETASAAAHRHPVLVPPDDEGRFGGGPYGDPDPTDDEYWATAELWLATGEQGFADALEASHWHTDDVFDAGGFDFDSVAGPARLDLAEAGESLAEHPRLVADVVSAARRMRALQQRQPWGQPYAPATGWTWGSNGRILNNLVVLATAARLSGDDELRSAVIGGMDYLLGRNGLDQSYVVGYGATCPAHPRTRQFAHDLDPAFPPPPAGAVVGGANSVETPGFPSDPRLAGLPPQSCYLDESTSETTNDICIRWNAPLVYVCAALGAAG